MDNHYLPYLCKVMNLFTKKEITLKMLADIQPGENLPLCKLKKLKPHTEFICAGSEAYTVFILLRGGCRCMLHSYLGDTVTADAMISPYVFGLMEPVLNLPRYSASVLTTKESYVVEVPVSIFLHAMRNDLIVANACISYFVNLAEYYMDMAEIRALYDVEDTLLLYIFNNCDKSAFPYTVLIDRKTMSHLLHINLRTMYRHLGKLQQAGAFFIEKGKIKITPPQFAKLQEYCTQSLGTRPQTVHVYPDTFQDVR